MNLLGLPTDIRLEIYDWVLFSTTLEAYPELDALTVSRHSGATSAAALNELGDSTGIADDDYTAEAAPDYEPDRTLFRPPVPREKLNLVCRLLNNEIGRSWHSKVTYCFPCTVAFADVLGRWQSTWKLEAVRRVYVYGYPLPLNTLEGSSYVTHAVDDALAIFPGLKLDMLEVENIWLHPDGEEVEGWCLGATRGEVNGLLVSNGWKELKYVCGTLGFFAEQLRETHHRVDKVKKQRQEANFAYTIAAPRPRLTGIVTYHANGGSSEDDGLDVKAEVAQWEADNRSWSPPVEKAVQVWAKRGTDDYAATVEGRSECLSELLAHFGAWMSLRESGEVLIDLGTEDPCAHL